MFVTKLKNVMVVALAGCLLGWGAKAIAFRTNDLPGNSAPKQVLKAPAPKPSAEDAKPDLPKGPAPIQVLASIDKEGQIVIQQIVIQMLQTEFTETGVLLPPTENEIRALHRRLGDAIGAGKGGGTGVSHLKVTGKYKTEEVKAFTANGKKVDPKDLAKKLEKEIPVLMAADGKEVDPLHLRLIKDGILVLVLPLPPAEEAQKEEERRREREILQKVIDKQNKDFGGANPVVPPSEDPKKP